VKQGPAKTDERKHRAAQTLSPTTATHKPQNLPLSISPKVVKVWGWRPTLSTDGPMHNKGKARISGAAGWQPTIPKSALPIHIYQIHISKYPYIRFEFKPRYLE
jgi:hypothetical protein